MLFFMHHNNTPQPDNSNATERGAFPMKNNNNNTASSGDARTHQPRHEKKKASKHNESMRENRPDLICFVFWLAHLILPGVISVFLDIFFIFLFRGRSVGSSMREGGRRGRRRCGRSVRAGGGVGRHRAHRPTRATSKKKIVF